MALFMDTHTIEGGVSVTDVAAAHAADLATQDAYGVNYVKYWVDEAAGARACQIGDPCWEGISARGLALLAEAGGDADTAFSLLLDARTRANRLADSYVWLDVHILDALCEMGRRHAHPTTVSWAETMLDRASRTGMRELNVRAMLHLAAAGVRDDAEAATLLAGDIDNPVLTPLVAAV